MALVNDTSGLVAETNASGKKYLVPFILITCLFFLWGMAHNLDSILPNHCFLILAVVFRSHSLSWNAYGRFERSCRRGDSVLHTVSVPMNQGLWIEEI